MYVESIVGLGKIRAVIHDHLHGEIPVNDIEYRIIETPVFNRLHHIKQLSATYMVYPAAKHSRWEHSLGAMHVAGMIAKATLRGLDLEKLFDMNKLGLLRKMVEDNKIFRGREYVARDLKGFLEAIYVQTMRLAGLLHDIAHYPYSHTVEEAIGGKGLHEEMGAKLILSWKRLKEILVEADIMTENGIGLTPEHIVVVLQPDKYGELRESLLFNESAYRVLHMIISSPVDADRLDYLLRDALMTGLSYGEVELERIIYSMRIDHEGQNIVFDAKALPALESFMSGRLLMYRQVYYHHKVTLYSEMLRRLIERALLYEERTGENLLGKPLRELLLEKYVENLLDQPLSMTDELIMRLVLRASNQRRDPKMRYYARAFIDREIMPFTLFKRDIEIRNYMKSLGNAAKHIFAHRGLVEEKFEEESRGWHLIVSHIRYHGVKPENILVDTGDGLKLLEEVSDYIAWLAQYYDNLKLPYIYIYCDDESLMRRLKNDLLERRRVIIWARELLRKVVKELELMGI